MIPYTRRPARTGVFIVAGGASSAMKDSSEAQMNRELNESWAADRVLNQTQSRILRRRKRRRIAAVTQAHAVVGRIKAGMIEDVEEIGPELKVYTLSDLELLGKSNIKALLERRSEQISAAGAKSGFERVVKRHPHLAWSNQRHREAIDVEGRFGGVQVLVGSLQHHLARRESGLQRQDRIDNIEIAINRGDRARKI